MDHQSRAANNWLVKFEHSYPGGGIDGDKLWLDESQFSEVNQRINRAGAIEGKTNLV
jgi:hypothetical protein